MRAKVLAVPFSAKHQIATKTHKWGHQHVSVNTTATMATGIRERITMEQVSLQQLFPRTGIPVSTNGDFTLRQASTGKCLRGNNL